MASETVHHTAMTLSEHLPILKILVPFVAAPLIVFIGRRIWLGRSPLFPAPPPL